MQTLLIVDDEPNIVEGLASQFEEKYRDKVIVLKSFSGNHALSVLKNNQIDVVLSDICMPDLDGLELIRETEKLWPRTHFVFLSGFDDFQYIHRASKSSLYRGYLLKMEGDEVVLEKINQEIRMCEEACAELEQGELRRQYMNACRDFCGVQFWRAYYVVVSHGKKPPYNLPKCHNLLTPEIRCFWYWESTRNLHCLIRFRHC